MEKEIKNQESIVKLNIEWDLFQKERQETKEIIMNYKTKECKEIFKIDHDESTCGDYHSQDQRRRLPFEEGFMKYRAEMCLFSLNFCRDKEDCEKSHNIFEFHFHPSKYLTTLCNFEDCKKFGQTCPFAHSNEKLRNGELFYDITQFHKSSTKNKSSTEFMYFLVNPFNQNECDLNSFKTLKCSKEVKHNHKQCIFYHSKRDMRRVHSTVNYSPELCVFAESYKACPNSENCLKSHNKVEQFYHPEKFKTKFCANYSNIDLCEYGLYCSFAHSEDEIKCDLIHKMEKTVDFYMFFFKTVFCPVNYNHDKFLCCYWHNYQDYRRPPLAFIYRDKLCENWDNRKRIIKYSDGCSNDTNCENCHGWKEYDYHPMMYKTRKCQFYENVCPKGNYCQFYHIEEEKRIINDEEKEKIFNKLDKFKQFDFKQLSSIEFNISHPQRNSDVSFSNESRTSNADFRGKKLNIFNKIRGTEIIDHKNLWNNLIPNHVNKTTDGGLKRLSHGLPYNQNILEEEFEDESDDIVHGLTTNLNRGTQFTLDPPSGAYLISKNSLSTLCKDLRELQFKTNFEIKPINREIFKKKILNYLKDNEFNILYKFCTENDSAIEELIHLSEDEILRLTEKENIEKLEKLKIFITNLEDKRVIMETEKIFV